MTSAKPPGHRPAKTSRIVLRATEGDRDLVDRALLAEQGLRGSNTSSVMML